MHLERLMKKWFSYASNFLSNEEGNHKNQTLAFITIFTPSWTSLTCLVQCRPEILQTGVNKHTYFIIIVQYRKGIQVQTPDSKKADPWKLALSYLLAWLHYHIELVPSRPSLIALHHIALCNVDFSAKACGHCYEQNHLVTRSLLVMYIFIRKETKYTAKPTYLRVRERKRVLSILQLQAPPCFKSLGKSHTDVQPTVRDHGFVFEFFSLSPSSVLAYLFVSPGIATCWRWGSWMLYGQPDSYIN